MFEGLTCVYRSNVDLFFYVIGSSAENEVSALLKLEYMSVCKNIFMAAHILELIGN